MKPYEKKLKERCTVELPAGLWFAILRGLSSRCRDTDNEAERDSLEKIGVLIIDQTGISPLEMDEALAEMVRDTKERERR